MVGVSVAGVAVLLLSATVASAWARALLRSDNGNNTDDDKPDPCMDYFPCFNMGECKKEDLDYTCKCYDSYFENKQDDKKKYCHFVKDKCKENPCKNVNETCDTLWANSYFCYSTTEEFDPMHVLYDPSAIAGHPYFILIFLNFGRTNMKYNWPTYGHVRFDTGEGTIMQKPTYDIRHEKRPLDVMLHFSQTAMYFQSTAARTFFHKQRLIRGKDNFISMLLFYTYHSKNEYLNVSYTYAFNPEVTSEKVISKSRVHVLEDHEECTPDVLMIGCSGHAAGFYEQNSTPILWDYREGHSFRPHIIQSCAKENSTLRIVWVTHNIKRNITTGFHEDFAVKGTRHRSKMDSFDLWQNAPVFFVPPKYEHAVIELLVYETIDAATVKRKISFYNSVQCQINTYPRVPITVVWGGVSRTHARGDPFVVDIRNSFMPWTDNPYYWPNSTELKHWMYWRICLEVPLREHQYNDSDDMEYLEKDLNKGCRKMHYEYQNFYNNNWHENYSELIYVQNMLNYEWYTVKGHYTYDLVKEWYRFTHYTIDDSVPGMNADGDPRAELSSSLLSGKLMSKISVFNVSIRMYYSNIYTTHFHKAVNYKTMLENRGIRVKLIQGSGYPLLNIRCLRNCGMGGPWTPDSLQDKYKTYDINVTTRVLPNTGIGDDLMIDTTISSVLLVECIERCSAKTKKGDFYKWEIFSRGPGRNGTLTPLKINWKKNTSPQNSRVLSLDGGQLKTNQTYVFRVTPTDQKVKEAYTEFLTQIQGGLKATGTCKITPAKGITGVTEFEITCEKYEKNYAVSNLNYEFFQEQEDENGTQDELLLEWTFHSAVKHIVLAGTGPRERKNKVKVKILDTFGGSVLSNLEVKLEVMNNSKLKELASDTDKPLCLPLRANAKDVGGVARLSSALVDAINAAGTNVTEDKKKKYFKYIVNAISQVNVPCIETVRQINGAMKKIGRIAETYVDLVDGHKIMAVYAMVAKQINTYSKYYWSQVEKVRDEIINALEGLTPVMKAVAKLRFEEKEVGNDTFDVYDDLREIQDMYQAKAYSEAANDVVTNLVVSKLNRMIEKEKVEKKAEDYYFHAWVNWTGNNKKEFGDHVVKLSWDYKPKTETLVGFQLLRFPSDIFSWSSFFQKMEINSHLVYIYLEAKDYHRSYGDPIKWVESPSTFKFNITKPKVKIKEVSRHFLKYEDDADYASKVQIYRFYLREGQHLLVNFTDLGTEPVKVAFIVNRWPSEDDFKKKYFTIGSKVNLTAAEIAEAAAANPDKHTVKLVKRRKKRQAVKVELQNISSNGNNITDEDEDYEDVLPEEYVDKISEDVMNRSDYGEEGEEMENEVAVADKKMGSVSDFGLVYDSDGFSESYMSDNFPNDDDDANLSQESDIYLVNPYDNYESSETNEEEVDVKFEDKDGERELDAGREDDVDELVGVESNVEDRMDVQERKDELDSDYIIKYTSTPTVEKDTWVYMGILPFAKKLDKLTPFSFKAMTSSCQEWLGDRWSLKRCKFNYNSTPWFITCDCPDTYFRVHSAATYTTKGAFFIPPESEDIVITARQHKKQYHLKVYMVLIIILGLFIALFIWAMFCDKDDKGKRKLIVLPDNSMEHSYGYLLTVYTGCQKDAGTSAKIGIQLYGSIGHSKRHILHSDQTQVLQDGSTDWFMLYTPESLGDILKIHVWSNCNGHRQAWFCSHIVVRDIQLQKAWTFMVQRWLSLVRDEGMISFRLRPTPKKEIFKKHRVFLRNLLHFGGEGHMWFNIFTNHPRSFYSRQERVLVCAFGTFLNIFLIVILYQSFVNTSETIVFGITNMGPYHLLLALLCSCGCLVSSFFLTFMFRKSTPFSLQLHRVKIEQLKITSVEKYSYFDVEKTQRIKKGKIRTILFYLMPTDPLCESHRPFEERIKMTKIPKETCEEEKHMIKKKKKKRKKKILHYHTNHFFLQRQFRYLAWVLVILGIGCLIGMSIWLSEGKEDINSLEWFATVLLMVSFSVLIVEPVKAYVTALISTYIIQVEPMDYDMERGYPLLPALGTLHDDNVLALRRALQEYAPVTTWYIPELRAREKARLNYYAKSFEIACVFVFALVVFCTVYTYIDERRAVYLHHEHLRDMFVRGGNGSKELKDVRIVKDIFDYIDKTFIPLFLEIKNSSDPTDLLYDEANRLIGQPRLRQLRVKRGTSCPGLPAQEYLSCLSEFSMDTIDRETYYMGWSEINPPTEKYSERAREQYWKYLSHTQTKSIPIRGANNVYPGGGYIADLGRYITNMNITLQYLKRNRWLDDYTSFVALEVLLYNVNTGFMTYIDIIFEKDISGYLILHHNIRTVNLNRYPVTELLVMELLFGLIICGIVYYQILALQLYPIRRYFQDWWRIFDVFMAVVSGVAISLYLIRRTKVIQMFHRIDMHQKNQYISLVETYIISEVFLKSLAFLIFLTTIRIAKAGMNIFCFRVMEITLYVEILAIIFITFYSFIVLMACTVAAFLSLGYRYEAFKTPASGLGMVTATLFGVRQETFSIYEVWFVKLLFGFIVAMSIIIVNMYRAVLFEAYTKAKSRKPIMNYGYVDYFREEKQYHCKCRKRTRKMKTGRLRGGADESADDPRIEGRPYPPTRKEERGVGLRWHLFARDKIVSSSSSSSPSSAQDERKEDDDGGRRESVQNLRGVLQTVAKRDEEKKRRVLLRKTVGPLLTRLKGNMQEVSQIFDEPGTAIENM